MKDEKNESLLIINTHHIRDSSLKYLPKFFFVLHITIKLEMTSIGVSVKSLDFLLKDSKEELLKISVKNSSNFLCFKSHFLHNFEVYNL